ncbi:hypothetical protein QQS21_001702 [Conoideocrella luteorostrata]|uniref:Tubby C-terminal-like domain-containing protein n=1 Tax=Conoideocrella luteorostrata TaxID=1105319 RepID=A0AAJ0CWH5_9HYPO|nr:hypothetical protein QQS21_001702 [Conoideocrella luteorostrata]
MAQLQPVAQPIGIYQNFIAKTTETLVLKEKVMSLSGDSFDITNTQGMPFMKIKGKHMSLSGRKSVFDMAGNHLYDIVKEHFHLHATYAAEDPNGTKLLTIKSSMKLVGSKATAQFKSFHGTEETLVMSGSWLDTSANIVCERTGATVAKIDRKLLNAREFFGNQQTYALVVAPGVDMALMVALCIALDEKNNEK